MWAFWGLGRSLHDELKKILEGATHMVARLAADKGHKGLDYSGSIPLPRTLHGSSHFLCHYPYTHSSITPLYPPITPIYTPHRPQNSELQLSRLQRVPLANSGAAGLWLLALNLQAAVELDGV